MKSVRVLYKKQGRMHFMSHLDTTRFMTRLIRRAKLPVWYTEGFNPHPYITFALPLSLGHDSLYEVMDFRLSDDGFDISKITSLLNEFAPEGIEFFDCFEPVKKAGAVAGAYYEITFDDGGALLENLSAFVKKSPLFITKKTKRGEEKQIDVSVHLKDVKTEKTDNTKLFLVLPAGGTLNINPELLLTAFFENNPEYYCYSVVRRSILDSDNKPFR